MQDNLGQVEGGEVDFEYFAAHVGNIHELAGDIQRDAVKRAEVRRYVRPECPE